MPSSSDHSVAGLPVPCLTVLDACTCPLRLLCSVSVPRTTIPDESPMRYDDMRLLSGKPHRIIQQYPESP